MADIMQFPAKEKEETEEFWLCGECDSSLFYAIENRLQCAECGTEVEDVRVLSRDPDA